MDAHLLFANYNTDVLKQLSIFISNPSTDTFTSLQNTMLSQKYCDQLKSCSDRKNLTHGKIGTIDTITCSQIPLILKTSPIPTLNMTIFHSTNNSHKGPNPSSTIKPIKYFAGSTEFINETIIGLLLNLITPKYSVKQHLSSICQENIGLNIQEKADQDLSSYINSDDFNILTFDKMLLQLIKTIKALQIQYNFIHGDLKAKNILVKNDIAKIADYGKSSITVNNIRFYNRLDKFIKRRFITFLLDPIYNNQTELLTYNYNLSIPDTNIDLRHRRSLFYLNFDIYTLLVSIALEHKIFYNYIKKESEYPNLFLTWMWKYLWINKETQTLIENRIEKNLITQKLPPQGITTTFHILKNTTLKYF